VPVVALLLLQLALELLLEALQNIRCVERLL